MKAIIVGGGVAGTVSAVALRRAGADVTVFEAYDDPAGEVGSFLSLTANGLRGLAAIGCLDRVRDRGFPGARQWMWSGSGKLLGDVARGRRTTDPMHSLTLMRCHLVAELRAAAVEAGVRVITGERLTGLTPAADGARARFASGRVEPADLVVGADGIWSATRQAIDPRAPAPRYAGIYVLSGVARGADLDALAEPGVYNMTFGRNGTFMHLRTPGGDVWWHAQVASRTRPAFEAVDTAGLLGQLGEHYRAERTVSAVIAATTHLHRPTVHHVLDPVPVWHDRHTVLVGDAAHLVGAGQGAAMAIEDGLALAVAVAGAPSVPAGLDAYERVRRPRITKVRKTGDDTRDTMRSGPVRRRARELIMPIVVPHVFERATGWLYDYDPPTLPVSDVTHRADEPEGARRPAPPR